MVDFFPLLFFFLVLVCVVVVLAARGGWKTVPLGVLCMFPSGIYRKSDASVRARECFLHFWHRGRFSVLELAGWALGTVPRELRGPLVRSLLLFAS